MDDETPYAVRPGGRTSTMAHATFSDGSSGPDDPPWTPRESGPRSSSPCCSRWTSVGSVD